MTKEELKEFNKEELISALLQALKFNMLPSMEKHLTKTLNIEKWNRLVDSVNVVVRQINKCKKRDLEPLHKKYMRLKVALDKQEKKLIELGIIKEEEQNEPTDA